MKVKPLTSFQEKVQWPQ